MPVNVILDADVTGAIAADSEFWTNLGDKFIFDTTAHGFTKDADVVERLRLNSEIFLFCAATCDIAREAALDVETKGVQRSELLANALKRLQSKGALLLERVQVIRQKYSAIFSAAAEWSEDELIDDAIKTLELEKAGDEICRALSGS